MPKKGQALRLQGPDLTEPAPASHVFQLRHQHILSSHTYQKCILVACEKHAAVLQTQVARRTETGLVAIRSRQRVSERRSPEQGENGSAGCWPQKIHPHTQLLQAQAKTRSTRKHPGRKRSRTDFAQSMRKTPLVATIGRGSQLLASPTTSFNSRTTFPKYAGYFDSRTPDHFSEIFRIFRR